MNKKLLRLVLSLFAVSALCSTGFATENDEQEGQQKEEDSNKEETGKCTFSNPQSFSFSFSAAADLEEPSGNPENKPEESQPKTNVTIE